jgi:glycosyltransferase involved in cell wall biosynthesis
MFCALLWGNAAVERRARAEIEALTLVGCHVRALTQNPAPSGAADRWPAVAAIHPEVAPPSRVLRRTTSGKLISFVLASFDAVRRWTRVGGVDVVISHTPTAILSAWPWTRSRARRSVYVCHTPPRPRGEPRRARHRPLAQVLWNMVERQALTTADLVVCPSPSSRDFYAQFRPGRETLSLENPIDISRFRPDPNARRDIDVLFVGRLSAEKGADVLLHAAAKVERPLRMVLIGQGRERERLEELAATLPGDCELIARVDNDELPRWYQRARVVVVPSFTEAGPVVPLEAMACGTPIIASAVTGLVDLVDHGENGWLFPPGDAVALAGVMSRVLPDDSALQASGERAVLTAHRMTSSAFRTRVPIDYGVMHPGLEVDRA